MRVPALAKGVYTVDWRVVSRVDGHPTAGAYSFGVGVTPEQSQLAAAARDNGVPSASAVEVVGRFVFLLGVIALLGAACAGAVGYAGADRGLPLAALAWFVAVVGLAVLTSAQRASAAVPFGDFLETYAGRAFEGRAVTLGIVGVALLAARLARSATAARVALATATTAAAVMIAIHVSAGHAATSSGWTRWVTTAGQWSHFAAAGVWIGGLAALLLGIRGAPSREKARAVRRFSGVAAIALAVVVATGIWRSIVAIHTWDELVSTGYGRAILVKVALVVAIALLALRNRLRSVPAAEKTLSPLRRASMGELSFAVVAIGAAALLGSLSPPVEATPLGLTVSGVDASGTVKARLETKWAVPGPNHFDLHLTEAGAGDPLSARRVTLRFLPLDDPGVAATTLPLHRGRSPGTWVGSGDNMTFAGRWQASAITEHGDQSRVVPLELHLNSPPLFLSLEQLPGKPVRYTVQLPDNGFIRLTVAPARSPRDRVSVEFFDYFSERRPVAQMVLTASRDDGPTRQLPLRRTSPSSFVSTTDLAPGPTHFAVIGRTAGRDPPLWDVATQTSTRPEK